MPKEIGQLVSLHTFSCSSNQLTILPKEIGQLVSLHTFSCSSNQLTILPKEIGQLVSLHTFYCYNNLLDNIQITENKNNLLEVKQYFESYQSILTNAIKLLALLRIESFISQKVIPKYFEESEEIYLSI